MDERALALQELRTAADLNTELRELKARSRLTYRQLEERAAEKGELLPRSTLADVLRNGSLPRPELLAAFVRACGEGEYVDDWLAARKRAAEASAPGRGPGGSAGSGGSGGSGGPGVTGGSRDSGGGRPGGVGAGLGTAAPADPPDPRPRRGPSSPWRWSRPPSGGPCGTSGSPPGPGSGRLPSGQVLLRPLGSPGLCVTDGQAPDGRYRSLVAVQRPCDETAPQTTTLDPVGDTAHRIVWYRPDQGKGCLKALTSGAGAGLLEPWEACDQTTAFRFVPAESREDRKTGTSGTSGTAAGRSYLIKVPGGKCAGIRDGSTEEGGRGRRGTLHRCGRPALRRPGRALSRRPQDRRSCALRACPVHEAHWTFGRYGRVCRA
ncbi:hypothetical protein LT493_14490 [Streptomyces tricolor]|nr:hypothetical protein [Streptomyces tricolor]